ncbi:MAG: HAD family hydrolase [Spirochaetes bacterium]|nr:MAG: HAD family hydrolase [Spirochaetota bacterium]
MAYDRLSPILAGKRACMFDLFHTLTSIEDTTPDARMSWEILGVPRDLWIEQLMVKSPERLKGSDIDPFATIARMARAIRPDIPDTLIRQATENRKRIFRRSLLYMPKDSLRTLSSLKRLGMKIGLVSNADTLERAGWEECPAAPFFDSVVFSCDVGFMKPEPGIYEISLRALDEHPERCVFSGDGGSEELRGAREAGITTVLVHGMIGRLWPELIPARRIHADHVVERVSDLLV